MPSLRPLSSALLSVGLMLGGQLAAALPVAEATPEPGTGGQTSSPGAPAVAPQGNWGSCGQFLGDDTAAVLREWLQLNHEEIRQLAESGTVA